MLQGRGPCDICEFGRDMEVVRPRSDLSYARYPYCSFSPSLAYIHGYCDHFKARKDHNKPDFLPKCLNVPVKEEKQ